MSQIPSLISDLAVILISAGLVTLLFKWLKQPVVLGYIVAGILAGPSITQIPTVTNIESIRIWADIGVIFLLFALGLDFSFKKLMKVGGTAVIGAITIVIGMMTLGYTIFRLGTYEQPFPRRNAFHVVYNHYFQSVRRYGTTQSEVCRSGLRNPCCRRSVCRFTNGFTVYIGSQ